MSGLLLLVYAGQLSLGHWQTDEFRYFTNQRLHGAREVVARLAAWPRPFSELLIYLYGQTVLAAGKPLVGEALALLWAGLVAGMVLAARASLRPSPFRLATSVCLGIVSMVFLMETYPITEMFYWPVSSVAYLPTIDVIVALLFLMNDKSEPRRRLWCGIALTVAATSHEIGAAFAIGVAVAGASRAVLSRGRVAAPRRRMIAVVAGSAWWLVPGMIGLTIIGGVALYRSAYVDLGADTKPYTGHLMASALAAGRQLSIDFVTTGDSGASFAAIAGAVATKSLFAIGFALVWLRLGDVRLGFWRLAFAFGLVVSAFFSLAAAFYHYGDLCCERQSTIRHWLIDLLWILAAAGILSRLNGWPITRRSWPLLRRIGPGVLTVSSFPVIFQLGGTREDFRLLSLSRQARAHTWASGQQHGTDRMTFYLPPDKPGMLVHGTSQPLDTYVVASNSPPFIAEVARFFGKFFVTTCQRWQTDKSWLYDGNFIPACPPHAGPPDIVFNSH